MVQQIDDNLYFLKFNVSDDNKEDSEKEDDEHEEKHEAHEEVEDVDDDDEKLEVEVEAKEEAIQFLRFNFLTKKITKESANGIQK